MCSAIAFEPRIVFGTVLIRACRQTEVSILRRQKLYTQAHMTWLPIEGKLWKHQDAFASKTNIHHASSSMGSSFTTTCSSIAATSSSTMGLDPPSSLLTSMISTFLPLAGLISSA